MSDEHSKDADEPLGEMYVPVRCWRCRGYFDATLPECLRPSCAGADYMIGCNSDAEHAAGMERLRARKADILTRPRRWSDE